MTPGSDFTRIFPSELTFRDPTEEANFAQVVLQQAEASRRNMGWDGGLRSFTANTWLWKRDIWQKKYEQDYEYRKCTDYSIFRKSNIALNPILKLINQGIDKLQNDLLSGPQFFTAKPSGSEDTNPALDAFKERLYATSKEINLDEVGREAAKGAFIRGHEVTMSSYCTNGYIRPELVSFVAMDGKVLKDADGVPIPDSEEWIVNPANPDAFILAKELDRPDKIVLTAEQYGTLENGHQKVVMQYHQDPRAGCHIVYYGDFFCDLTAKTIADSVIKGHVFRSGPAELMLSYPPEERLPAAQQYLEWCQQNPSVEPRDDYQSTASVPRPRDGEDNLDTLAANQSGDARSYRERTYYYGVIRYDANQDGYAEDVYFVMDVQAQRLLHYEYAALVFPWIPGGRPHPYNVLRIWPKPARWYGTGYYELLEPWELIADLNMNRIEVDSATSGNIIFEDPTALEQSRDGSGIQFRTQEPVTLRPGMTKEDAIGVVTVAPANLQEFSMIMEKATAQIELAGGAAAPQDATTADMPGSDTLGVAKILENTSSQSLRARESEIIKGLTAILHSIADIEAYYIKKGVRAGDDMQYLIDQLGEEKAVALMEWLPTIGDKYRDSIEVNLSKSSSTQMVEAGNAVVEVLIRWMNIPPEYKPMFQKAFIQILIGLDVPNPEEVLNLEQSQMADMALAEQAAAAESQPTTA